MGKDDHDRVVKVEKLLKRPGACLGICAGKDCARNGAKQVIRAVHAALEEAGLAGAVGVELTKCQDYCDHGPAMTVLPGGLPYVELDAASAREVVLEHVRDGRPVLRKLHKRARRKLERRLAAAEELAA
jgi:NADH-quinone oxidoreductase subunit F